MLGQKVQFNCYMKTMAAKNKEEGRAKKRSYYSKYMVEMAPLVCASTCRLSSDWYCDGRAKSDGKHTLCTVQHMTVKATVMIKHFLLVTIRVSLEPTSYRTHNYS